MGKMIEDVGRGEYTRVVFIVLYIASHRTPLIKLKVDQLFEK